LTVSPPYGVRQRKLDWLAIVMSNYPDRGRLKFWPSVTLGCSHKQ